MPKKAIFLKKSW